MSIARALTDGSIIQIKNLKKRYGSVNAVSGITFEVESGKLFAFLGPNGAGKSTTIDMICHSLSRMKERLQWTVWFAGKMTMLSAAGSG